MTRAGRGCQLGLQPDRSLTSWHREPGHPRIGAPLLLPTRRSCETDAPLEGPSTRAGVGTAASPGSQTRVPGTLGARVTHTSRGSQSRRSGQGRPGCTRMGHSGSRLLWGSAVLGDSAWWTLLLVLAAASAPVLCGALPARGGCYGICVAPGSGVCREARDGACVMYAEEEHTVDGGRYGSQGSSAQNSMQGVERVKAPEDTCTPSNSAVPGKCEQTSCTVLIGENTYCSKCSTTTEAPIDGVCKAISNDPSGCQAKSGSADGTCASCTGANYFLYKGGCYKIATPPGSTICKTAGTAGICEACQAGYFKNPANLETSDSCIACSDATGVTVSGGATYKGVANCAACTAPAKAESDDQIAACTVCVDGYYGAPTCTNQCDNTCKSCTGAGTAACTSCKTDNNKEYLKVTDPQAGTGECVADETACKGSNTHFLVADTKTCYPCGSVTDGGVADCQTCTSSKSGGAAKATTVTCSACTTEGKKPNANETKCVECTTEGCAKCSDEGVCLQCSTGKLTPTNQCVDKCEKLEGYFDGNDGNCAKCNDACKTCAGAASTQCLSCPAGKVLKYTDDSDPSQGGSCVDECTPGTGAGGCEICGAVIGGSKYCSKCSTTTEVSVNGICTADNTRAAACTTKDGKGGCSVCASGYFLLENGCYKTDRQPGKSVCTTESGGKCTKCANGQTADQQGSCPACPAGCSTCSGSSGSQTCSECLAGYYLSGTTCVKCDKNSTDNKITGVENCVSCAAPTGSSGPVLCYLVGMVLLASLLTSSWVCLHCCSCHKYRHFSVDASHGGRAPSRQ
ncbi:Variant-specific surface protein [Giardia duodenalis]|uniref:Variant-specific surface protein n=1 Tax=Giardia intestinalis TaxID=5741 RepID=V6TTV9_GIAIN|nr:Variant-specific surface protein [Giardia intestinalis]